eukprot:jgi/Orpsp1_1/1178564/evm.model.c7180000065862.1
MSTEKILLGMGNPLLDMIANTPKDMLTKYSLKANDSIMAEEKHMPIYEDLMKNFNVTYVAGGATQNSIRGAQWLLPPNSTTFIGCVGNDEYAKALEKAASDDGVYVPYMHVEEPTGTCACLITDNNRSLVANLSAAEKYKIDHLKKPEIWELVEKAKCYYIGGFFFTHSHESIMAVAKHAAENNKVFTQNLSAPFLSQFYTKFLDEAAPYWDIIFGNETEAAAFAEAHNYGTKDVKEIALKMAAIEKVNKSRPRMVVITQGALPTIVAYEGKITEFPVRDLKPEEIVDTNAAGDAFVGGFLSQYVQGKDLKTCIDAGNYVAYIVLKQSGATFPKLDKKEF